MRVSNLGRTVALIIIGAVAAAPLTVAAEPSGVATFPGEAELAGEITTADGSPAAGATVQIEPIKTPEATRRTTVDDRGGYQFANLVHGYYRIAVEYRGEVFAANRVLLVPPGREVEANFQLTGFELQDELIGLGPAREVAGMPGAVSGVARLEERIGPTGWAWFRTGKGVAVLVGGGALLVAGLIALSENDDQTSASPLNP